jgi:hypothetical protein
LMPRSPRDGVSSFTAASAAALPHPSTDMGACATGALKATSGSFTERHHTAGGRLTRTLRSVTETMQRLQLSTSSARKSIDKR